MNANVGTPGMYEWERRFSQSANRMQSSLIREILKMMADPELISFSGGMPAAELFPIEAFQEASHRVLGEGGVTALQYGITEGYTPLREWLVEEMRRRGADVRLENILIINGSQQALDFVGRVFLDSGDTVLTGNPTYLGALMSWRAYGARYATVPVDAEGMCVDQIEDTLTREPAKFIYVLPNFHNPAGVTLSAERRRKLVEIAARHRLFVVEDDPYGELRFEGEALPPLVALDSHHVIYASTFSKTLSPGIRLGWVVAPTPVIAKMVQTKQGGDLHTSVFIQMIAHDILSRGFLPAHVTRIRDVYRKRRDIMIAAMEKHFPPGVTWNKPEGGLFLWLKLPEHVDSIELLKKAIQEEKVAFIPGEVFFPNGGGKNYIRLNFSASTPERIEEGIKRLARVLLHEFG